MKPARKPTCHEIHLEDRLFVAIVKLADSLAQEAEQLIKVHGLTGAQYNVCLLYTSALPTILLV